MRAEGRRHGRCRSGRRCFCRRRYPRFRRVGTENDLLTRGGVAETIDHVTGRDVLIARLHVDLRRQASAICRAH
ncbi:putative leader peptide [Streptoalloteichus hindustanus]|uniref:putative leader peptide n=1 Tax=Streptoalloteichus hindustanus TaxID=2017 RepID=UPI003899CA2D